MLYNPPLPRCVHRICHCSYSSISLPPPAWCEWCGLLFAQITAAVLRSNKSGQWQEFSILASILWRMQNIWKNHLLLLVLPHFKTLYKQAFNVKDLSKRWLNWPLCHKIVHIHHSIGHWWKNWGTLVISLDNDMRRACITLRCPVTHGCQLLHLVWGM